MTLVKTVIFVAVAILVAPAFAQQGATAVLSPVPIYPPDGNIPETLKDRFVFLNPATNEIVISYPDQRALGQRVTQRFSRHNQVDPVVTATVTAQADGLYQYSYVVQNGPQARKTMQSWALVVGGTDSVLSTRQASWAMSTAKSPFGRPGAIRPDSQITWSAPTTKGLLAQGQSLPGFRVTSRYKPGITIAYAQAASATEITAAVASQYPKAVSEQLALISDPKWDSTQTLTIGPKFDPNDPKELIALDFHHALNQLAVTGVLKADSPFVTEALSSLVSYMQSPAGSSPSMDFASKASAGLESDIASAMRMSLR